MTTLSTRCRRRWARRGRFLADFIFGFATTGLSHVFAWLYILGRWTCRRTLVALRRTSKGTRHPNNRRTESLPELRPSVPIPDRQRGASGTQAEREDRFMDHQAARSGALRRVDQVLQQLGVAAGERRKLLLDARKWVVPSKYNGEEQLAGYLLRGIFERGCRPNILEPNRKRGDTLPLRSASV